MENTFLLIEYTFVIALIFSIIGFIRTVWFISIGYTASVVAMCVFTAIYSSTHFEIHNWLQTALLAFWGIRLGSFLVKRELNSNYTQAVKDQTQASQEQPIGKKLMIWISVSLLYVIMFSPIVFALQAPYLFGDNYLWVSYFGVMVMALGLLIEALADHQKSAFKKEHPKQYCSIGLYQWVRCPNYLGEIMIWTGNLIVALAFMQVWWQWVMAFVGWLCIVLIMMGSTKRLEKKQQERYGEDAQFQKYTQTVPVLFPWLPIYSLAKIKVYLE